MRSTHWLAKRLRVFGFPTFAAAALLMIVTIHSSVTVPASAENISKTFEFGPGTPYATSIVRTFPVVSGLEVATVVKFKRLGQDGNQYDIPIEIELREPDTENGAEGPLVETKFAYAARTERTEILHSLASNRGCSRPWRVRVKYSGTGSASAPVFGTIRFDFDARMKSISAQTAGFISKGAFREINIGDSSGFGEGQIGITCNWNHMIGPVPGPDPIKLRMQVLYLIDNNPSKMMMVGFAEGYSSNESRSGLTKFKLIVKVRQPSHGQWKIIITNLENDRDVFVHAPTVNFAPLCP